jgi:CHAT domain-containing protein/tetratricopeptide (TPR) repeat protein
LDLKGRAVTTARPFLVFWIGRWGKLRRVRRAVHLLILLPFALAGAILAAGAPAGFQACEALAASQPEKQETARCFEETGTALGREKEAIARLEALREKHPGSPWIALYLSFLHHGTGREEGYLRSAAEGFARQGDPKGEVSARSNLQRVLLNSGRVDEAGRQAELATEVAEASGDSNLIARATIVQARFLWGVGTDLERAYLLLKRAEASLFPEGQYYLQRDCLNALGNLSLEVGLYDEGFDAFRRLTELAAGEKDAFAEATGRYNMTRARHNQVLELPTEQGRREVARLAEDALASARRAGHRGVEAKAYLTLGLVTQGEESHRHFDACLAAADNVRDRSYCLNGLARHLAEEDPRAAQKAIDESLALAREAHDYWSMAYAWRERMRVSWASGSLERTIRDSRAALDAIEAIRDAQAGVAAQARMFSVWAEDYLWLTGRLVEAALEGKEEEKERSLEHAFRVAERMRARSLLDSLDAAGVVPAETAPGRQRRAAVLESISGVQRRLLDPSVPPAERQAAAAELQGLEIEEATLRNQLAQAAPVLATPEFASLEEVREALGPTEALLAFQVAPWVDLRGDFAGGSWLLTVTRERTRIYRLPGRGDLRPAVRLFLGTFERRDGSEASPSVHLFRMLLNPALDELPSGVERLILLPDDALHQLPFGALRPTEGAPALAERYELSVIPSASVWLTWRKGRPEPGEIPVLALADPPPPGAAGTVGPRLAARERSAAFAAPLQLGALPHSRRESRAVVRHLGGGSVRRLGARASETFLKAEDLGRYALLHFATHAVTDDVNPERSGVLLAPGAPTEDGLLQIREIVDLAMPGRIVVLSACSSASGTMLRGEGVMGLARAFFQSGAHAVVGSLWPLRDDEAADLFDRFYHHVGRGLSVSGALREAQRDLIDGGAPAAAWAGVLVLGDGGLVPLPGGRKGIDPDVWPPVAATAAGLAALLAVGVALRRRRRPT